ncbi:MAG: hypothetical protein HDS35_10945 [Bacteroides sp.]|nr:hypothetical protein [Bacteroides sp.]
MTYSNEDFEHFYIRYKVEAFGRGETMQSYCSRNKEPSNLFLKWSKDTRHWVVEVKVDEMPSTSESEPIQSDSDTEFHTVISTCHICGLSALDYLRSFFRKIIRDYRLLLSFASGHWTEHKY